MAWDDDFDYFVPADWSEDEAVMFDEMVGSDPVIASDTQLQFLYQEALFDMELNAPDRQLIIDALEEYLWEEYDIVFDDVFDWDAYREWYESA